MTRRVAIFGGGVAGMTAAHELIERGFDVDVYEQHPQLGGKCRNYPLPGTGTDGRPDLFGTCGGHFFFGAYPNLGQTLGRIPLEGGGTVLDNLTTLTNQHGYISLMAFPELTLYLPELSPSALFAAIRGKNFLKIARGWLMLLRKLGIRDSIILESKVLALVTTGEKRRWQQLEHTGLSQFLRTDKLGSTAAQVGHLPKLLFSFSETEDANTRVAATWLTQSICAALGEYGPGFTKAVAMLAGPEAQMWFDPWELHLTSLGVRFHKERAVTHLAVADGRIDSATVVDPEGNSVEVDADWFVLALPPSKANELVSSELLHVAPELGQLSEVPSARMGDWLDGGGLLLFLKHRVSELGALNIGGLKPWALICEPLSSRWRVDLTKYGDGTAVEYVTLQMAHLESLLGESGIKPISHSSKEEITNVALAMLRINIPGGERIFADSAIHSVHIPGFIAGEGTPENPWRSDEEMFSPGPSCWQKQRQAVTSIPNLMLAGTLVRTTLGSENMDSANESGKHAAAAIGQASGLPVPPVPIGTPRYPALLRRLHALDDRRFDAGKRNIFDVFFPLRPAEMLSTKRIHASKLFEPADHSVERADGR